ncbi:MAG TPA: class I SAM-dependent methyltransferase [Alphaproteobacteria bacterium]|jgi:SAM-dependent methyltransferase|nr:class I SAM-dependent methyltransferase [Alphaproteobacteria bacterium]MDP6272189.1 class I SAM-dependent methyltransferase [Alphaproteobacteria bacterium]MDP7164145.1 class I SAM-dependent methyltransferase [Alphaproteobacteria bacterium]MDP7427762.1 class I SAM-dependent methyltransferase [Alphaproteobacteria bacterium]HJM49625.1 class I SAM-dependent methyltransferase [Alphaproteobacteria bacterium]
MAEFAPFAPCAICAAEDWSPVHQGPVRNGRFGSVTAQAVVARCGLCGADRLDEENCRDEEFYADPDYRKSLGQGNDTAAFLAGHQAQQSERLQVLGPVSLQGCLIADVGCAGGAFLDQVAGPAAVVVAIEPGSAYHDALRERRFTVYSFASEASAHAGSLDWAFSFDVIEHVADPKRFLADIATLLKPEGRLLLSTPNRDDGLLELAGEAYRRFFYRVHHRWYFDAGALTAVAERAGLEVERVDYVQRYGLSNAVTWMREARPSGDEVLAELDNPALDRAWQDHLEQSGRADRLYALLRRSGA